MSTPDDRVAVVGAGTTPLVAELVASGYRHLEVIDISPVALHRLRAQLGDTTARLTIRCADVRTVVFADQVDVWHDRAVFHFFTDAAERALYAAEAVRAGGHRVMPRSPRTARPSAAAYRSPVRTPTRCEPRSQDLSWRSRSNGFT